MDFHFIFTQCFLKRNNEQNEIKKKSEKITNIPEKNIVSNNKATHTKKVRTHKTTNEQTK